MVPWPASFGIPANENCKEVSHETQTSKSKWWFAASHEGAGIRDFGFGIYAISKVAEAGSSHDLSIRFDAT